MQIAPTTTAPQMLTAIHAPPFTTSIPSTAATNSIKTPPTSTPQSSAVRAAEETKPNPKPLTTTRIFPSGHGRKCAK